jgi:hypothetical protein
MDLCFRESGNHIMRIEVLDGDLLVLPPVEYTLTVDAACSVLSHSPSTSHLLDKFDLVL